MSLFQGCSHIVYHTRVMAASLFLVYVLRRAQSTGLPSPGGRVRAAESCQLFKAASAPAPRARELRGIQWAELGPPCSLSARVCTYVAEMVF